MTILRTTTGALLAGVGLLLASGTAWADSELTVLFGGDPQWVAAYEAAAKRFEAEHPGVKIVLNHTPHGAYGDKVAALATAQDLPDVMQIDAPYLANYVWSGLLQPIEAHLDPKLVEEMTASNKAQSTYPIDSKLYATSLIDSAVVLYGNKRYLEAAGARIPTTVEDAWTGEEFQKILGDLAKVEGVEWPIDLFRSFGPRSEWVTYAISPIFQSYGCDLIDRTTWRATGKLDSKPCVDAATMIQGWANNGWLVPGTAANNVFYAEGQKAALAWGPRTYYPEAARNLGEDNIVVMPLPRFGEKVASPNGTWIWGISTAAEDPALAGQFISFLLRDADYRQVARETTSTPALASFIAESPLYAPGGPLDIAMEMAEKSAVARPGHPAYPAITEAFKTAMDAIYSGADPQGELTKAAAAIDAEIDDNDGFPPFGGN